MKILEAIIPMTQNPPIHITQIRGSEIQVLDLNMYLDCWPIMPSSISTIKVQSFYQAHLHWLKPNEWNFHKVRQLYFRTWMRFRIKFSSICISDYFPVFIYVIFLISYSALFMFFSIKYLGESQIKKFGINENKQAGPKISKVTYKFEFYQSIDSTILINGSTEILAMQQKQSERQNTTSMALITVSQHTIVSRKMGCVQIEKPIIEKPMVANSLRMAFIVVMRSTTNPIKVKTLDTKLATFRPLRLATQLSIRTPIIQKISRE